MTTVHFVLPNDIDDPARPSGGNRYDRRLCGGLTAAGWSVVEHAALGGWPTPDRADRAALADLLSGVPAGARTLLDGLVASSVPEVLAPHGRRLRLGVLVHMPLANAAEGEALAHASVVVTTSEWSRRRLLDLYPLPADRIHVATPGVDPAPLATGTPTGTRLLTVAAVSPHKGHDLLAEALTKIEDSPWTCTCVGSLERDPTFVDGLRSDRVRLTGALTGAVLDAAYADADLLVVPSRGETYGMVVTEALARGIPVVATDVGGVSEALGRAPDGSRPGLLVPPEDPAALADALSRWLGSPELRARLRRSAHARRATLTSWSATATAVATALTAPTALAPPGPTAPVPPGPPTRDFSRKSTGESVLPGPFPGNGPEGPIAAGGGGMAAGGGGMSAV